MSPVTVAQIRVEASPPGSSTWTTLNTDTIVDDLEVTWSRPTPRDHPDPGDARLTLIAPADATDLTLIEYDTRIRVDIQLTDGTTTTAWLPVIRGWIQAYRRNRRRIDNHWRYDIDLMDILGRAAATLIGMTPRPDETVAARLAAINTASKAGPLASTPAVALGSALARDVDNINALQLIHETLSFNWRAAEGPDHLLIYTTLGSRRPLTASTNQALLVADYLTVRDVDADSIVDTGRYVDRTNLISEITYRIGRSNLPNPAYAVERTIKAGPGSFSSSSLSLVTDNIATNYTDAAFDTWAQAVITESQAITISLDPTEILLNDLALAPLLTIGTRDAPVVNILNPPDDIPTLHILTGATLHLYKGTARLTQVQLQPGSLFGVRPLRISDLADTRPRLTTPTTETSRVRLSKLSAVTAAALWPYN